MHLNEVSSNDILLILPEFTIANVFLGNFVLDEVVKEWESKKTYLKPMITGGKSAYLQTVRRTGTCDGHSQPIELPALSDVLKNDTINIIEVTK